MKQGPMERALEKVVSMYPISAKQNPYYGGSFDGNDCFRMMENVSLILETSLDATDNNASEQAESMMKSHHEIWESFAAIAPLLRSRRKFTIREQEDLILDTKEFGIRFKTSPAVILLTRCIYCLHT
jgi:hypothetical protein